MTFSQQEGTALQLHLQVYMQTRVKSKSVLKTQRKWIRGFCIQLHCTAFRLGFLPFILQSFQLFPLINLIGIKLALKTNRWFSNGQVVTNLLVAILTPQQNSKLANLPLTD